MSSFSDTTDETEEGECLGSVASTMKLPSAEFTMISGVAVVS